MLNLLDAAKQNKTFKPYQSFHEFMEEQNVRLDEKPDDEHADDQPGS